VKALEITVEPDGALKLPACVSLPARARLAVLVFESSEIGLEESDGAALSKLAEQSGAFDFLKEEPEIYSDFDILPGRENPRFRK